MLIDQGIAATAYLNRNANVISIRGKLTPGITEHLPTGLITAQPNATNTTDITWYVTQSNTLHSDLSSNHIHHRTHLTPRSPPLSYVRKAAHVNTKEAFSRNVLPFLPPEFGLPIVPPIAIDGRIGFHAPPDIRDRRRYVLRFQKTSITEGEVLAIRLPALIFKAMSHVSNPTVLRP